MPQGYNYTSDCDGTTISAAENVVDVDEDDVLIIDGLTKCVKLCNVICVTIVLKY